MKRFRRNMVTYPFHYEKVEADEFFKPKKGAVYLHIPFCNQKCKFCNFKAYKLLNQESINNYIKILKKHILLYKKTKFYPDYAIDAVYFGGGNPGLLNQKQTVSLLNLVKDNFEVLPEAEISMEFDPINVNAEKLNALKENGFNRISMGVQSFDDEVLKRVGRIHSSEDVINAHELMKKAGFKNVNLDLVYPFPQLTKDQWEQTVNKLLTLKPTAVSTYGFELWPGTPYFLDAKKGNFEQCSGETEAEMYSLANEKILAAGYNQLTVYGYVKKEYKAHYHCKFMEAYYWNNLPMVSFGLGSMNYINGDFFVNLSNFKDFEKAIDGGKLPISFGKHLSIDEQMRRFMIRGLKKTQVSKQDFFERYGHVIEHYFRKELDSLINQGLLRIETDLIKLTPLGCNYNTNVYREFFRADDEKDLDGDKIVNFGLSLDIDVAIAGGHKAA